MKFADPNLAEQLMMAANNKQIEYRRVTATRSGRDVYVLIKDRHLAQHWANKGAKIECRMLKDGKPITDWCAWEPKALTKRNYDIGGRSL